MTEDQVRQTIVEIIETVAPDADLSDIKGEVRLRDQLEMDSMDFLDIVMELRKKYRIEIPKEDYPELATLDGCVSYLMPKFEAVGAKT
jgi:acyl carrier protein